MPLHRGAVVRAFGLHCIVRNVDGTPDGEDVVLMACGRRVTERATLACPGDHPTCVRCVVTKMYVDAQR